MISGSLTSAHIVPRSRPRAGGKFIYAGSFRPAADGTDYPRPDVAAADFSSMPANGVAGS